MTSIHPARRALGISVRVVGGASAVSLTGLGVLFTEARLARRVIGEVEDTPPVPSGWYGQGRPGPVLKMVLLGDSSAAGYGVDSVEDTPGAILASAVAEAADRRVYLASLAEVGSQSKDLRAQVDQALPLEPHVAVILIGANDVTHAVPVAASTRLLGEEIERLRAAGVEVVLGTCPDLGTIEPLAPPLKQVARIWSRRLAAEQANVAVARGARTVALASVLGEEFTRLSELLFGPDRFHPSSAGYARMASVIIPAVFAALELGGEQDVLPDYSRGEAVLPMDIAVLEAARHPGSSIELVPAALGGIEPGELAQPGAESPTSARPGRPRFVLLRRPRRRADTVVQAPSAEEAPPDEPNAHDTHDADDTPDFGDTASRRTPPSANPGTASSEQPRPNAL